MIVFGEPRKFKQTKSKPDPGAFAVGNDAGNMEISWISCRDTFRQSFRKAEDGIYFSHEPGREEKIAEFINRTEDILEVPHSQFSKTNRNFAIWINPSEFWRDCSMKESLYTILLRTGMQYQKDYEEALYSHAYINLTKLAVMRFLFGCTKFIPPANITISHGWVGTFQHKKEHEVRQWLVQPHEGDSCLIGAGSLWR